MSGLSVAGAVVRYGSTTAVAAVDLSVAVGEVVAVLGPSGCGKSSLLRAVAGLEPLTQGTISWAGADLADVPVHRREFGLMFQDGQLFPHRDVAGNVEFGLQMARVPRAQRAQRVAELLELVGLAGYGPRPVASLSGGEQQRVALARALAPGPRLLLLDEPLSALDRALRERLAADLQAILRAAGTTALYVTHDHDEAFTVADRVAVMRAGHLVQVGTPGELWAAPADADVARFLGYRVVEGAEETLALAPHAWVIRELLGTAAADGTRSAEARDAANVRAGVGDGGDVTGTVTAVGFSRGRTAALVDVPGWGAQRATAEAFAALAPGARVRLELDPGAVVRLGE